MRLLRSDEIGPWTEHPRVKPFLSGPPIRLVAPEATTIYVEHEGLLAAFHPAPAGGVFFVHVASQPGVKAVKPALEILEFVGREFPQVETVIGLIDPTNRAVRLFARRIGFQPTSTINTARGPMQFVERI
jgi:hypothetical protein